MLYARTNPNAAIIEPKYIKELKLSSQRVYDKT